MARATVTRGQKGYVGMSKSVRAAMAEEDGAFPKSRWTKAMLVYWIAEAIWYGLDVEIDREELEAAFASLSKADLAATLIPDGWHHVGPFARPVDFFKISEINAVILAVNKGLGIARKLRVALDAKTLRQQMADVNAGLKRFEDVIEQWGYLAVK